MNKRVNIYKDTETKVGAGFYANRKNTSKAGIVYDKLVKADRSPPPRGIRKITGL